VQKGCHVWSNGKTTATIMQLHLKPCQKLSIMDMDVDAHQMLQFGGPMHLRTSGPMMAGRADGVMTHRKEPHASEDRRVPRRSDRGGKRDRRGDVARMRARAAVIAIDLDGAAARATAEACARLGAARVAYTCDCR